MYCSNCGYDLKEKQIENGKAKDQVKNPTTIDVFVCPRCGKLIKQDLNEDEIKALSRAGHAEIHRSRNTMNRGMSFLVIGIILLVIAVMFFMMSFKANAGGSLVTDCTEFYVFLILLVLGVASTGFAIVSLFLGIRKNRKYTNLLRDIQNGVFVQ
jgi:hypothetical protein